jgi:hypothetical protein
MSIAGIKSIFSSGSLNKKGLWTGVYFLLTVFLFFLRVVLFTSNYGSIEHDSGWFLGVAKNLAHRNIYASYINTIEEEGVGAHPSIRRGVSVQDEEGFSYFPIGVTVGPGYVFPQALLLKIFGDGWWQYRLWPLIAYVGLLFLLFYLVWVLGGIWALIIFQIWLWAIPQLTTTFAYEGFGEHIALFYLLAGYLIYLNTFESRKRKTLMFVAGCLFSFAVLTKLLLLLALFAFVPVVLWEIHTNRQELRSVLLGWGALFVGFITPFVLFEIYRFAAIVSKFDVQTWKAIYENIRLEFVYGGSGLHNLGSPNLSYIRLKLMVWPDVGMKDSQILWMLFLVSPLLVLGRIEGRYFIIFLVMYCAALTTFFWFVFISYYGWTRHAWHGLLLAMMLISAGLGIILRATMVDWNKRSVISFLIILLAVTVVVRFDRVELKFLLDDKTIDKWHETRSYRKRGILLLGLPHAALFSFDDQRETAGFFKEKIHEVDRIYYSELFLVSEMATLVDKVFYPLGRFFNNDYKNPEGGESYLIIGPYQQGRWAFTEDKYAGETTGKYCDGVVFSNPSYVICKLKKSVDNY